MAVLQKGNSIYPFWGENINLITGLDPLGLQVTSEATYATMLPGLSNLTNRLRYYGFYCWLIDFYFRKEKKGNQNEQYRFIRRAELMIAIIMQSHRPEITQITGSLFAANLIKDEQSTYNLAAGADKDSGNEKNYWKYPSGAFGQYYFGALQALSLAVRYENDKGDIIFNITQPHPRQKVSGKQLADAFDEGLTTEIKTLFYNCITKGKLSNEDIHELISYFAIDKINPESTEWTLYIEMLLDKDYPSKEIEEEFTFHRRNTITSLLSTANENNQEYDWYVYLDDCYKQKFENKESTDIGWYCYQLNEYWQYACGLIFYGTLQYLETLHKEEYLPKFISSFSNLINKEVEILENYITRINETEIGLLKQIDRSNTPQENAKIGFHLLFKLYANNKEQLPPLKEYMSRNGIIRDGNMVDGLFAITNYLQNDVKDFISFFIHKNIIYRHQMVALRKMGNGTQATNKFIIEEQMIRLIDIFPARWTSPRMNALRNLLFDLQVINDKGKITELHTKIVYQ
ncbi:hypothetical protein HZP70_00440 [Elizabethkingia anophelis]|nr:hypothetical protein [Elizabethkingia anophelis]MCT3825330.1 hypothetical protein [Elizabethkingia anophelis]MCT3836172.1 hypothetical protein [Elizabethkingia anophelis]MCT3839654.1 hypothetical protein [Elizabethkingia anophelis]MCT3846976.1 hypothetical protein [Elizabethkingia anophelis]